MIFFSSLLSHLSSPLRPREYSRKRYPENRPFLLKVRQHPNSVLRLLLVFMCSLQTPVINGEEALDRVLKTGKLRVAFDNAVYSDTPLVLRNPFTGDLSGIEVSLISAITREIGPGIEIKWVNAKWARLVTKVRSCEADLALQQIFIPSPEEKLPGDAYSIPYLKSGLALVVKRELASLPDAELKRRKGVAFNDEFAKTFLAKDGFENLNFADTDRSVLEAMDSGVLDYMVFDLPLVTSFVKSNAHRFVISRPIMHGSEANYGAFMRSDSPKLLQKVNRAIFKWLTSPERNALREKFGL